MVTTVKNRQTEAQQKAIFNSNAGLEGLVGDGKEAANEKSYKAPIAKKKEKSDLAALAMFGMGGAENLTFAAATMSMDDKTKEQMSQFTGAIKMAGSMLSSAGMGLLGLQAAMVAADFVPKKKDKLAKTATEAADKPVAETSAKKLADATDNKAVKTAADLADKPVAEAAAKSAATKVTDIADRRAAKAATEAADKPLAKAAVEVAETALETAAKPAAKGIFGKVVGGLGIAAKGLKKVPVLGAVVTGGFVAYEVSTHLKKGDTKMAFAAATAGGAEMAGNVVGFGVGDALREGTREAFIAVKGEEYEALNKSDIRYLGEAAIDIKNDFTKAADITTMKPDIVNAPAANNSLSQPITGLNLRLAS